MNRYFIELSYKGTNFHGWQQQPNAVSVQSEVEKALSMLTREEIKTTGAGRTDTGVHARFFVAHFEMDRLLADAVDLLYKVNALLPPDISVIKIYPVRSDAHARYSAITRTYKYYISRVKDPFNKEVSWYYNGSLDLYAMNQASQILLNCSDFTSFSKLHSGTKSNNCLLYEAFWSGDDEQVVFTIKGNRFLRNMVRSIVGTMIDLGRGKINRDDFSRIIEGRDRSLAGFSAPAHGLVLVNIEYPRNITFEP